MDSFARSLEKLYLSLTAFQNRLSERWRLHSNRRTLIIVVVIGAIALYAWLFMLRAPDNFPIGELVSVPQGQTLSEIADTLHQDGVIRSPLLFRILMTAAGTARTAQAGDYLFKEPRDLFSIVRAMSIGAFGLEPLRIRVPEGATVEEMSRIFGNQLQRFNAENFRAQALREEGYLFPDTYYFLPNANESVVYETLRQNFDSKIAEIQPQIDASGHTLEEIVTMASILEREAYNTTDRKLISGVLWNRIKRGMPLQVDAVFAYTLGKGTFDLTVADLTSDSPYNTYKFKGLPPTPIGAPSLDSLTAAVEPTPNDYLYFLADRQGITHYCKTYSCQLANKAKYF